MKRALLFLLVAWALAAPAFAKLKIVATTPDLQALARVVAGDGAEVAAICPPGSDPHFLEAKPSQIVKLRAADLLVANGAELESGWLPLLVRGARRPDLDGGGARLFRASDHVDLIEVPAAGTTRAAGDVHAAGNPHFMLDPLRAARAGLALADSLAKLDAGRAGAYHAAAKAFDVGLRARTPGWKARVAALGVQRVMAYHRDLNYFFDRLGLEVVAYIEPVPGLPPTGRHLAELVKIAREQELSLAVLSHLYPTAPAGKIAASVPGFRWVRVAGQVGGLKGTDDLTSLYESIVAALEKP